MAKKATSKPTRKPAAKAAKRASKPPKFVQIATGHFGSSSQGNLNHSVYALDSQGSVWVYRKGLGEWLSLESDAKTRAQSYDRTMKRNMKPAQQWAEEKGKQPPDTVDDFDEDPF